MQLQQVVLLQLGLGQGSQHLQVGEAAAGAAMPAAPKRRGRPPGSKNSKPKDMERGQFSLMMRQLMPQQQKPDTVYMLAAKAIPTLKYPGAQCPKGIFPQILIPDAIFSIP
jgi:hypothetical protein